MDHALFIVQDHHVAATVIFCISFVGSISNCIVTTSTQRLPSMRNSFGLLLTSQSMGEAVLCSIFAFYYSPMVFFNSEVLPQFSQRFGLVLLMCYDICIFSHLFIALNRMCAICFPWKYASYFSRRNTKVLIVISWVASIIRCLVCYGYRDCDFIFERSIWAFVFTQTEDCKFISHYLDFFKDVTVVAIIAVVDIITVAKVRWTSVQLRRSGLVETDNRRKKEINFLKQAVLQGMVFVVELYTYFHLAWQYKDLWTIWGLTTVAWNLVHCTDALIIIVFNSELRKLVASPTYAFKTLVHSTTVERITEKH